MNKLKHTTTLLFLFLSFFFCLVSSSNVGLTGHGDNSGDSPAEEKPVSPKVYLVHYWEKQISNDLPKPLFLINKASPMSAVESATFTKLASQNALSNNLTFFCSSAKLHCFPDLVPSLAKPDQALNPPTTLNILYEDGEKSVNKGIEPGNKKFTNCKTSRLSGMDVVIYRREYSTKSVNKWIAPGLFFRERMLKTGTVMPMPDIRDKLPKRSFLPRVIASKLPFSTLKLSELKHIFHASDNSRMESILADSLCECERAPNRDETKRCAGSAEDMIDFATTVLGRNVVVRATENTKGSKKDVLIGSVKMINGGELTNAVTCHPILFPYLLYYCHSVPMVRVYEADILDPESKTKINHGVALCHLDTSSWSENHAAFVALGSSPGKIEACHWIFENGMTWTIAD